MTFNFGGLAGGFAQGLQIGEKINELRREDQVAKVRAQGIAEARAMQAAATPQVSDQGDMQNLTARPQASADPAAPPVNTSLAASPAMAGVAPPDPSAPMSGTPVASADPAAPTAPAASGLSIKGGKRFMVGDAGFDDVESAKAHSASQAPDLYTIMRKTVVPKMQATYMEQGNLDKAEALGKWAEAEDGRAYMQTYSKAVLASQAGDWDKALDHMQELHKGYNDGFTISDKADEKDANGNVVGKRITYKNDQTGEEKTQVMDAQSIVKMGLPGLSPDKAFGIMYQEQRDASMMQAKGRLAAQDDARKEKLEIGKTVIKTKAEAAELKSKQEHDFKLADRKSANSIEEDRKKSEIEIASLGAKEKAKLRASQEAMREAGLSDDEIKTVVATKYTGGEYKKATSPAERRDMAVTELIKNPIFLSAKPDKQAEMKANVLKLYEHGADPKPAPKPAAAAGVARAGGKTGGVPVWDAASGTMIRR